MQPILLKFPKKSHRKNITIPSYSVLLAEFSGIIFGDGGINNSWQLVISLNSEKDKEFALYSKKLIEDLFHLEVAVRKRPNQNTLVLVCTSTTLVDFLVELGAARGNKILQKISIPSWIKKNPEFQRAFVKGLVDTDGCLYIHKHKVGNRRYSNIGLCFTSYSPPLIADVASILQDNRITPHIHKNGKRIYLYKKSDVLKYLNIFGSSNPRIWNIWWDAGVV